ncbi:MAG TPA: extracellular solute-binding protein [Aggregatilinea sp.]|uniref:ABC transporter substrate-binding protein n=1 Tax=Aggregatilinea sp. TaxID=2806333 RepID=UPI002BB6348C|nr:extracellular solute-binding protein [Aggregatilinea sp.]HML24771.1 extracellular solute-binding protein [Aggregatilinea sp.]
MRRWIAAGMALAALLAGCGTASPGARQITPTPATPDRSIASVDSLVTNAPDGTPTPLPTPDQYTVRVWWPDEIYPTDTDPSQTILTRQFDDFTQTYSRYTLQVRRKRANGLGGILPTLRTAQPVAPGTMPDLTLMRRADMVTAATEGLIVPIGNWLPPDILESLLPGVEQIGEIDGTLYGLPYMMTLYHMAYRESVFAAPPTTFETILTQEPKYLFPGNVAGQGTGANWTVLLQYLAAGGQLVDAGGLPTLDRDPLLAVYSYYEQGVEAEIFSPGLLTFSQSDDYWDQFETGAVSLVFANSTTYLRRRASVPNTAPASIPTLGGTPITTPDSWMWVLTTSDPDRQNQARAFLSWMMRVSQQSAFSESYGYLPTTQRAMQLWDDQSYATFAQSLMANMVLVPDTQRNSSAAAALQAGFAAVLDGTPAETAADEALQVLSD